MESINSIQETVRRKRWGGHDGTEVEIYQGSQLSEKSREDEARREGKERKWKRKGG